MSGFTGMNAMVPVRSCCLQQDILESITRLKRNRQRSFCINPEYTLINHRSHVKHM